LRVIVRAKTPADSMKRFRDFQRQQNTNWLLADKMERQESAVQAHAGAKKIATPILSPGDKEQVERLAAADIESAHNSGLTQMRWRRLALSYGSWWRAKKSNQARISAKQRRQPA